MLSLLCANLDSSRGYASGSQLLHKAEIEIEDNEAASIGKINSD